EDPGDREDDDEGDPQPGRGPAAPGVQHPQGGGGGEREQREPDGAALRGQGDRLGHDAQRVEVRLAGEHESGLDPGDAAQAEEDQCQQAQDRGGHGQVPPAGGAGVVDPPLAGGVVGGDGGCGTHRASSCGSAGWSASGASGPSRGPSADPPSGVSSGPDGPPSAEGPSSLTDASSGPTAARWVGPETLSAVAAAEAATSAFETRAFRARRTRTAAPGLSTWRRPMRVRTSGGAAMNSTTSTWMTCTRSSGTPWLDSMKRPPVDSAANSRPASTMPTGPERPSSATVIASKPMLPATPSVRRFSVPSTWTAPARPTRAPATARTRKEVRAVEMPATCAARGFEPTARKWKPI